MRKLLAWLKTLVDWAGTAFTLIGWFGWAAAITGAVTAVGAPIWAIILGVPTPIAIMAGYCTIAGAVVLTMSLLTYRAVSGIAAAPIPHDDVASQKPNLTAWQHVPKFTLAQAARLLVDAAPSAGSLKLEGDAEAWYATLRAEIQSEQLDYIPSLSPGDVTSFGYGERAGERASWGPGLDTEISREELKRFAERHGKRPRFLFPD